MNDNQVYKTHFHTYLSEITKHPTSKYTEYNVVSSLTKCKAGENNFFLHKLFQKVHNEFRQDIWNISWN